MGVEKRVSPDRSDSRSMSKIKINLYIIYTLRILISLRITKHLYILIYIYVLLYI